MRVGVYARALHNLAHRNIACLRVNETARKRKGNPYKRLGSADGRCSRKSMCAIAQQRGKPWTLPPNKWWVGRETIKPNRHAGPAVRIEGRKWTSHTQPQHERRPSPKGTGWGTELPPRSRQTADMEREANYAHLPRNTGPHGNMAMETMGAKHA